MSWEPIAPRFDELIHFPTRLRITAALATASIEVAGALHGIAEPEGLRGEIDRIIGTLVRLV